MRSFGVNKLAINNLGLISKYYLFIELPSLLQYYLFDDGVTFMRKGIRLVDSDEMFGVDVAITETAFEGIENTDFEMIYGILL